MNRPYKWLLLVSISLPIGGATCFPSGNGPSSVNWTQRTINTDAAIVPVVVETSDFDGDGRQDVVAGYAGTTTTTPGVFIFFQNDPQNFVSTTIASTADLSGLSAIAIGDLDGDGRRDLIAACNGRLLYLRSPADPRSAGWTASVIDQSSGTNINQWTDCAIGNIDGANGLDIVACNAQVGRLSWFRSPSTGITNGAGWTRIDIDASTRSNAQGVVLDNFNGDSRLDIISAAPGESSARIAWYANPTDPVAGTWTRSTIGNLPACTRVITADLDADGRSDVIAINPTGRQVGWYRRPTDATTAWSGFLITQYTTNQPTDVKAADLDGDNQIDLVVSTQNGGSLRWFTPFGVQTQQWVENNVRDLNISIGRFSLADIDGDGRPDVIAPLRATSSALDQVDWFENPE